MRLNAAQHQAHDVLLRAVRPVRTACETSHAAAHAAPC
jgi:hypothetical protein